MSVHVVDHGTEALIKKLSGKLGVRVGVIGSDAVEAHAESPDLTVVAVATKHEYGIGVPKRSFIRAYVDENESRLIEYVRNVGKGIVQGGDFAESMDAFGSVILGEIKTRIANHISPKLSKRRVDEKGSDTPLVDTGQLWSSLLYAVDGHAPKSDGTPPPGGGK